jgi:hypothetical protein
MELDSVIKEAISWFNKQRDHYFPSSAPLDDHQKTLLGPFFSAEILDRARILDLSQTRETLPYPPFYETVRAGGNRVLPDAAYMTAIAFLDVIVFNQKPSPRTLFQNLVPVTQFVLVGTERVIKGYCKTLNEVGLWMVVPFEEHAYQLDARYT